MQEGAQAQTAATIRVVEQFGDALNDHDIDAMMELMTDDCVVDNTSPPPDGERFEGQEAVRRFWEEFFRSSSESVFHSEDMFASRDRCVLLWRYDWAVAGTCAAWMCCVCETGRLRRNWPTSKDSECRGNADHASSFLSGSRVRRTRSAVPIGNCRVNYR